MVNSKEIEQTEAAEWPFGMKNYIWFGIAIVVIVIGYFMLGAGSMTMAPFLLVLGYCVLIPVAIMVKGIPDEVASADQATD